jgi:enolase
VQEAGYTDKIKIACDPASSEFFKDGSYDLNFKDPQRAGKELLTP